MSSPLSARSRRYTSPVSPLYLPCISPVSPLYLPCISPVSPLYLLQAPHYMILTTDVGGEQRFASSVAQLVENGLHPV